MAKKKEKKISSLETKVFAVQKTLMQWEKTRKRWKTKFYLTVVFPVVLIAIILKAVKSYVRIKLMEIGMKVPLS